MSFQKTKIRPLFSWFCCISARALHNVGVFQLRAPVITMALLKLWSLVVWSSVLVIHRFHTTGILVSAASDDTVYCFSSRDCVTGEFCEPGFGFCMPCSYICTGVGAARSSCVKFGCTGKCAFCFCVIF